MICFDIACLAQETFVTQRNIRASNAIQERRDNRKVYAKENTLINTSYAIVPTILGVLAMFLLVRAILSLSKVLKRKKILNMLYEEEKKYFKIIKLSKYLSNQKSDEKEKELSGLLEEKENELKILTKLTKRKKSLT